jgi:hypothetical protein
MSIKLSELLNQKKTVTVELKEGPLEITFNPGAFSSKNRENIGDFATVLEWYRHFLAGCILEWDLAGEDGKPVPVTEEVLSALPDPYVEAVFEDLRQATAVSPKKGGSSSDT